MKDKQIIIITGGHISPALALIDAMGKNGNYTIKFAGRKYAQEGHKALSVEYQLITERNIPFIPIRTGRLQRSFTLWSIPSLLKIPVGFVQAVVFCLQEKPALIVSFGGYIALPVALAAWVCSIPVITHEQTLIAGLANRIIAKIAVRVCVTFPEMAEQFPSDKSVYTGLPFRDELFRPPEKFPFPPAVAKYPVIYITGGSTGAQSLNRLIYPVLPLLLRKHSIIHQVGVLSLQEAERMRESLSLAYKNRYIVRSFVPMPVLAWVMTHAILIIGRSGANTVMELAALGKPAVLIPLPWSGGGEQKENACWLAENGSAVIIDQNRSTSAEIQKTIQETLAELNILQSHASTLLKKIPRDGTQRLIQQIEHIIHSSS